MKGCEAYLALCGVANSTVAACKAPGPIPNVLWTYDTKRNGKNSTPSPLNSNHRG